MPASDAVAPEDEREAFVSAAKTAENKDANEDYVRDAGALPPIPEYPSEEQLRALEAETPEGVSTNQVADGGRVVQPGSGSRSDSDGKDAYDDMDKPALEKAVEDRDDIKVEDIKGSGQDGNVLVDDLRKALRDADAAKQ